MKTIELDRGYRAVCAICGEAASNADNPRTFSIGTTEDTACMAGVLLLCGEHRQQERLIVELLQRVTMVVYCA